MYTCMQLLEGRVPASKLLPLPPKVHFFTLQTMSLSMSSFFLMHRFSIVWYTAPSLTFSYYRSIFAPFYTLLVLRDVVFLKPLHKLMHTPKYVVDCALSTLRIVFCPERTAPYDVQHCNTLRLTRASYTRVHADPNKRIARR